MSRQVSMATRMPCSERGAGIKYSLSVVPTCAGHKSAACCKALSEFRRLHIERLGGSVQTGTLFLFKPRHIECTFLAFSESW